MGIDLRLLPCEAWHESDGTLWGYSHTILDLGGVGVEEHDAFDEMVRPHVVRLPAGHEITSPVGAVMPEGNYYAGEHVYGRIRDEDAYGRPYEAVAAEHLLPWLAEHFQYDGHLGRGPYQAAIVAYVRALPPETKIILDWH